MSWCRAQGTWCLEMGGMWGQERGRGTPRVRRVKGRGTEIRGGERDGRGQGEVSRGLDGRREDSSHGHRFSREHGRHTGTQDGAKLTDRG